jgi:outer membrane autotransporter protein
LARRVGLSASERSVADHLQAVFGSNSPGLATLFGQFAGIGSATQYKQALDSLSNETINAVGTARLGASHSFATRMYSCPEFEGMGTLLQEHDCAWGRVIGAWADRTASSDAQGYTQNSQTVQLGLQREIADGWFLGGSIAYETSSLNADAGAGNVNGDSLGLGLVLKRQIGQWEFAGALDASYSWYDSTRNIALGSINNTATGSFGGEHAGVHGRISYQIPRQSWYLKPYVDLHAVYMRTGAYTEAGAGALNLAVDSSGGTRLAASPMLEVGARIDLSANTNVMPFVGVGGTFYNKNEWSTNARFVGASDDVGGFQATSTLPKQVANLNVGATLTSNKNLQVRLEYTGQFGQNYNASTGSLKLSYLF